MGSFLAAAAETGEPVSLIARLTRIEPLINDELVLPSANRVAFEFDCIDARVDTEEATAIITGEGDRSRLAVLKILTTARHFAQLAVNPVDPDGLDFPVLEGQWYRIKLSPIKRERGRRARPYAWASSLGDAGYEENIRLVPDSIRYLLSDAAPPLRPVGAAVDPEKDHAQQVAIACSFPKSAIIKDRSAKWPTESLARPHRIVVRDVGQASLCSAIDDQGKELFHLDAGWPISFNLKTAGSKPKLSVLDAPVILSHWDWDHLHGYHAIPGFSEGTWIAPVQHLGPGAARVAHTLAKDGRLYGVHHQANLARGPIRMGRCKGKAGNLNQTGLCIEVTLRSGKVLRFMGDADYRHSPSKMTTLPNYIVATHHGAKFSGRTVSPAGRRGTCVVSVGKGNGYRHPSETSLARHKKAGWSLQFTCEWGGVLRGDRCLGP